MTAQRRPRGRAGTAVPLNVAVEENVFDAVETIREALGQSRGLFTERALRVYCHIIDRGQLSAEEARPLRQAADVSRATLLQMQRLATEGLECLDLIAAMAAEEA